MGEYGVYIAIGVALLLGFVVLFVGSGGNKKEEKKKLYKELDEAINYLSGNNESSLKDCVVRLDIILGKALAFAGIKGETVGERLKNAKSLFQWDDYNKIWQAHKLRNTLVHENINVSDRDINYAVNYFKFAIRRLLG
ncbi:hypothetical protein JW887_05855 [Candidatus Dojkabacteria bacterium]|nr:hypothetical protein [Candidatus Dojkabacteria bacterium]